METFEAIRTVLAIRQFKDTAIPEPIVREIVDSAHLTASSKNGQPWNFIVIKEPEALKQLGRLARTGPYIAQAPMAIVVVMEKSPYDVSDASRAIQSMILTAWSHGVGSNWVGFSNLQEVNGFLGIPRDHTILAIVPFGYPVKTVGKGKKNRKPLGEVVFKERWGTPFK